MLPNTDLQGKEIPQYDNPEMHGTSFYQLQYILIPTC